jgi:hypothetical protein
VLLRPTFPRRPVLLVAARFCCVRSCSRIRRPLTEVAQLFARVVSTERRRCALVARRTPPPLRSRRRRAAAAAMEHKTVLVRRVRRCWRGAPCAVTWLRVVGVALPAGRAAGCAARTSFFAPALTCRGCRAARRCRVAEPERLYDREAVLGRDTSSARAHACCTHLGAWLTPTSWQVFPTLASASKTLGGMDWATASALVSCAAQGSSRLLLS